MTLDTHRQELIDYLASFGLDANKILADGWTDTTYEEFTDEPDHPGWQITVTKPWPEGLDVNRVDSLHQQAWARETWRTDES